MKMPFGKYKDQDLSNLPNEYVAWLLTCDSIKGKLREDLKSMVWFKIKDECLQKWVDNNYTPRQSNSYYSGYNYFDNDYDNPLYDAMDGCLPNQ